MLASRLQALQIQSDNHIRLWTDLNHKLKAVTAQHELKVRLLLLLALSQPCGGQILPCYFAVSMHVGSFLVLSLLVKASAAKLPCCLQESEWNSLKADMEAQMAKDSSDRSEPFG